MKTIIKLGFIVAIIFGIGLQKAIMQVTKSRPYKIRVKTFSPIDNSNGYLIGLKDSSIVLSTGKNYSSVKNNVEISINDINKISARRKGRLGRSVVIGGFSGAVFGAILGYATGSDNKDCFLCSRSDSAQLGAFLFGIAGTVIGAIVGAFNIRVPIKGYQSNYEKQKVKLKKYMLEI
jgi:hypothetical protein